MPPSSSPANVPPPPVRGEFTELNGETFYRIGHYDRMPPFFMSVVSASDHWLFISSTGGLTAGRVNPDSALFPYGTEDRVAESAENTGAKTLIRVRDGRRHHLWEPFSDRQAGAWQTERALYKNVWGTALVFEETNRNLELTFRQAWRTSDARGFVRTATLISHSAKPREAEILDGFQNLLPYGVNTGSQGWVSVLLDAYKRNELDSASGVGLFTMTSGLTDHAEPCESLKATVVWQDGLESLGHLLCSRQLDAFRDGRPLQPETDVCGRRGAYFVHANVKLPAGKEVRWNLVADVNQDHAAVAALLRDLAGDRQALRAGLETDIAAGTANLRAILAAADGLQAGADRASTVHHTANVLFNTMRGGIFADGYRIEKADFTSFLHAMNRETADTAAARLAKLPDTFTLFELHAWAAAGPAALRRLCFQYLPITFSRRHGDPSRPWNYFSVNVKKADGSRNLDYQGNWRDIFQNWEALAFSYPAFLPSMTATFLNATTADGYNPYRVFRHGIDWEKPDPGNPWSNIGYWGDHQIIYLLKLLEAGEAHEPGRLAGLGLPVLLLLSSLLIRFAPVHRHDDYRGAAVEAERLAGRGHTVWWVADYSGGAYYGLPLSQISPSHPPASPRSATGEILFASNQSSTPRNFPDAILLSRPDNFDRSGTATRILAAGGYTKTRSLQAFDLWERQQ